MMSAKQLLIAPQEAAALLHHMADELKPVMGFWHMRVNPANSRLSQHAPHRQCMMQVAIGVRVFGDARKGSEPPSMDAYLAQRGQPVKGPIHFGPDSPCGRPGLAQYQLFLPLQQVRPSSLSCPRAQLTSPLKHLG